MSPYLLFGFLAAGLLSVLIPARMVERHLGGRGIWPVVKASALGAPLPLCSCGVIPVAASLRRHGASKGATTAFLLSTPQTGVDSIMVTLSLLGPVFAIFRPLAALVTGFLGGGLVNAIDSPLGNGKEEIEPCQEDCCAPRDNSSKLVRALRYGFATLPADIGKPLLVGLIIAGLISASIPDNFFAEHLSLHTGLGAVGAMFVMMLFGIPMYVCATASAPIAAALMAKGVPPGAALVFLLTGPATNAAAIATIGKVMGRRTAAIYLATVAVTALASGLVLNGIFAAQSGWAEPGAGFMLPGWLKTASAAALLGILAAGARKHAHATDA